MMYTIHAIPAFTDNYIWCMYNDAKEALVVDPGDAEPVKKFLAENQLTLKAILVTHHHYDHTDGIKDLTNSFNCQTYGFENSKFSPLDNTYKDKDSFSLLGTAFAVITVPGHTLDHISFYNSEEQILFCGDTLFAGGCGRIFEGTAEMMYDSLQKLATLPTETRVYCTHEYTQSNLAFAEHVEPSNSVLMQRVAQVASLREQEEITLPSTIETELKTNPFLRCSSKAIHETIKAKSPEHSLLPSAVFATLRQWKDNF